MLVRLGLGLVWLLHFLPLSVLARIGDVLGTVLYALGRARRRVCLINLARCFPEMAEGERRLLARRHFRAYARSMLEHGILWWSSRERILGLVRVLGREHLEAARGKPLILLAPHFVGLDAGVTCLGLICHLDMTGLYSNQSNAVLNKLLLAGRQRFGRQLAFSRQDGIRPILRAVRDGFPIYYLPDMDYGPHDAIFVPFFGVPAATITGMSRIARLTGAQVVPCVSRILPGGAGYELACYPAWENYPSGDEQADTRRMNAFIEERVREMPEQYLWTHKRFKTRPPGEAKWY
jgi:Kdo2-lipid IVA lauroyltransferase/acyltransferase